MRKYTTKVFECESCGSVYLDNCYIGLCDNCNTNDLCDECSRFSRELNKTVCCMCVGKSKRINK